MRSLQARMFLVFALIATLPLLALSYLALAETRVALAQEVGKAHEDAATAAAGFVDVYVENGRVLLDAEARSPALREAAHAEDRGALALRLQGLVQRNTYGGERIFVTAVYLNETGRVVAAYPTGVAAYGDDWSRTPGFILPRARNEVTTLGVPPEGQPVVPIATPVVLAAPGKGVLLGNMSVATLGDALQAFAPGRSRGVFLADVQGRVLWHPNEAVDAERPEWGGVPPVALALSGASGYLEYDDPGTASRALGAYAPIPRLGWAAVDSVPTETAYAALTRLTAVLVVLSGILAGAILVASVLLARGIVRPVQELTEAARDLSQGRLSRRIALRGRDEVAELGNAFNEMANRIGESLDGLRRSEARYRGLIESANDLIFTIQPDGELSFVSPLAQGLLGRRPVDLMGRPARDLVHPADRDVFEGAVQRVLEKREPVLFVPHRLVTADGGLRDVLTTLSPVFDHGEAPMRVLGVARDVTGQRHQELVREKSFQMARLVSEEAELERIAGRGLKLLLGVVAIEEGAAYIGSGDDLREVAVSGLGRLSDAQLNGIRVLASLAAIAREPRREVLDAEEEPGRRGPTTALAIPLLERGESLGAVVLVGPERALSEENLENVDILTALAAQMAVGIRRSLFEQRLKEYAAELETRVEARTAELTEKSQEMESFLYSVSHDLKAPLISIQGYAQGLEEDYGRALQGDGAMYLERIRRNATLMESLILDILELSRIGRIRERVEPVDMQKLLGDIAHRLGDRFAAAGGRLVVEEGMPVVAGEAKRLGQLFTNLVDNAMKYRDPTRPPVVEIGARETPQEWVFLVRDNGRGIPARYHDQIFNIFQRVPAPGLEDPGGTGMGLAIVKRIAETHGGRVWLESQEGEGSVFHVALPKGAPA